MKYSSLVLLVTSLFIALASPAVAQRKSIIGDLKKNVGKGMGKKTDKPADGSAAKKADEKKTLPAPADGLPDAALFVIDINGSKENLVIKLLPDLAPKTVENFKKNIESGFYNGQAFHRVIRNYLVQTGDPLSKDDNQKESWGTTDIGLQVPLEPVGRHKRYSVAMAHKAGEASSSGSQFYICLRDAGNLDGQYAVFGEVILGQEVLNRMSGVIVDTNDVPLKRIQVAETKLVKSNEQIAEKAAQIGSKKSKPDSQKGPVEKFIERIW